ncbi:hydroxymethylglutaryl-CoA synthase family protein [Enterobacter asburiae]
MPTGPSLALPGISAFAVYVPPFKVSLEEWCQWTNNSWDKVSLVTGESFRMPAPWQNVYTMAANAVLRLILNNDINPETVSFLGLGTESSTDNSAGAVIIRGIVDKALEQLGLPKLSRHLEVPEFKHACLGGIYGLKAALRYVAYDGQDKKAIVVSADIAEYERGSSGEQTQGAGAVAMLVEMTPRLLTVDLSHCSSVSSYRETDFRKPAARHRIAHYQAETTRGHDFPVFNGRYSTHAYLDAVTRAVEHMATHFGISANDLFRQNCALCFHRPYQQMPLKALAFLYVRGLMHDPNGEKEAAELCHLSGVERSSLLAEKSLPDELIVATADRPENDPFPMTSRVADCLRRQVAFQSWAQEKIGLGTQLTRQLGNLYSASLPANLAAMLEEGYHQPQHLSAGKLIAIGYGSGDAAEALPMQLCSQWHSAAGKIGLATALQPVVTLDRKRYESLHDRGELSGIDYQPSQEVVISHIGQHYSQHFQDIGIEYYTYIH